MRCRCRCRPRSDRGRAVFPKLFTASQMPSPIPLDRISRPGSRTSESRASTSFLTEESPDSHSPRDVNQGFPQSPSFTEQTIAAAGIRPLWKRDLHALLEQPASSRSAFLVAFFFTVLIIFSALVTVLETVPAFHSISDRVWFGLETSLVALFTVEYVARCVAWSDTWISLFKWVISMSTLSINLYH